MPLELPRVEWATILPETILVVGAMLILLGGALLRRRLPAWVWTVASIIIAAGAMVSAWDLWRRVSHNHQGGAHTAIANAVVVDGFSVYFALLTCGAVILAALMADSYLRRERLNAPEFHVLMLLSASGALLMAAANDLIVIFLGLEVLSIALYVLAGFAQRRAVSREAAMKYFVLGAFSSAIFLYGVALAYGATGSTNLGEIAAFLRASVSTHAVLLGAFAFLIVGLGFKIAAVPFHMWTPDVYQGSPTPVTGFMAAVAKAAGFAALLRIFFSTFGTHRLDWQPLIWALAVLSILVGSVLAVVQTDVKRMLAYSSISHAGYILIGLQAATVRGLAGSLFYLLAYTFMVLGSFGIVTLVARDGDARTGLDAYRGLGQRRPGLALVFTVLLLAQAGVPLTSGFLAKFYVISAAVEAHSYALAIIAMLAAVIAAFFYLRVIVVMYMAGDEADTADADPIRVPFGAGLSLAVSVVATVIIGTILAGPAFDFARHASILRL
ncbi:MAG: NADH-quinone oxidoreductase subunit [Acidimicrobiales bacterium]|jgi:NADH-quinone oxidoreductase subunit N|nr:NADH-quinone oxidoreductase subunit [Acidimicrobiales bacterium]